uniref:Uncharacterized protein n=1 Tax=Sphaerodactylus townsendi TaxID=933632 RepID=A0ACB8G8A3_9SAUR
MDTVVPDLDQMPSLGVPLDTSKLPADQRLPPYPYSQPGMVLQQSQKALQPQQAQSTAVSQAGRQLPSSLPLQSQCSYPSHYQSGSVLQHQLNQPLGDFGLGSFDQYGMVENMPGGYGFNNSAFPEDLGALNYPMGDNMGLSGGGGGAHDPHLLNRQNLSHCSRHGPIPNIIFTEESPPGISKEIANVLAGMPGFEVDSSLGLDEDLKIEPLTLDGLNMLNDPYTLLTDPAVEDSFRTDRL